jgi:hypothetical protein
MLTVTLYRMKLDSATMWLAIGWKQLPFWDLRRKCPIHEQLEEQQSPIAIVLHTNFEPYKDNAQIVT